MKIATALIVYLTAVLTAAAGDRTYPSGFSVALDRGDDLSQALPSKFGEMLAAQPVALQPQDIPRINPIESTGDSKVLRQVSVSAGFIDLINHLAHAKAIDKVQPGFFDQYVQNIARIDGNNFTAQSPPIVDDRFWKDDILNDQASYFNQMVGIMVAINLSHHYLGHYDKYAAKLAGPGNQTVPINDLLTPAEWEVSMKEGAVDAMTCALRADGAMILFDAIDKMPGRPAWTEVFVPKSADLKKLSKEMLDYQQQFDQGGLKFGMLDNFQFRPAWDQPSLISQAKKTFNGSAPALAVIQRPMIDIHSYELIGQFPSHIPGVLQGVSYGFRPVVQTELDAVSQNLRND